VSAYQLNKAVFETLRREPPTADLTGDERAAVDARDMRLLYEMGLHPVLLNAFARFSGLQRDDYRALLAGAGTQPEGVPRWRASP